MWVQNRLRSWLRVLVSSEKFGWLLSKIETGWITDCGSRCLNPITTALWEQTQPHTPVHTHTQHANIQSTHTHTHTHTHTQSRLYCFPLSSQCISVWLCVWFVYTARAQLDLSNQSLVCASVHGCVTTPMFLCICVCMCVFCHISRFSARWKRLMRPPSLHSCNSVTLYTISLPHLNRRTHKCNSSASGVDGSQKRICFFLKLKAPFHFPFKLPKTKQNVCSKSIFLFAGNKNLPHWLPTSEKSDLNVK